MLLKRNPAKKSHVRSWLAKLRNRRKQIALEFAKKENTGKVGVDGVLASI